jgi:hypothetical protein
LVETAGDQQSAYENDSLCGLVKADVRYQRTKEYSLDRFFSFCSKFMTAV